MLKILLAAIVWLGVGMLVARTRTGWRLYAFLTVFPIIFVSVSIVHWFVSAEWWQGESIRELSVYYERHGLVVIPGALGLSWCIAEELIRLARALGILGE
jgi:hypothetical protein